MSGVCRLSLAALAATLCVAGEMPAQSAGVSEPAASTMIKRTINSTDPIKQLMDQKKELGLDKTQLDTLKALGKEMRHMQDLVYTEIDKAAKKEKEGEGKSARNPLVSNQVQERITRLQDIQAAYRDRARTFLTPAQRAKSDTLNAARTDKEFKKP
jgi:hypothetical protein